MALDLTPEYAQSLGRIGGQLLSPNLEFQGDDVQFDTDLLYLDVVNKRIGINNYGTSPNELYLGNITGDQALYTNALIVDGTTTTDSVWTISTNNIQLASGTLYITPATLPAVTGSILFPTSSYLASGTSITLGTTLTVECWFKTTSDPATSKIVLVASNGNRGVSIYNGTYGQNNYSATKWTFDFETAGNVEFTVPTMSANTWYHLALTQNAGVATLWLNGTRSSSNTINTGWNFLSTAYRIGGWQSQNIYSQGVYISNVRITNTAVYDVTQTSITVPTSPLTAITGTQLLLNTTNNVNYLKDSSSNNITMTVTGSASSSSTAPSWAPVTAYITANGVGSANVNITDRLLATKNVNESLYLTPDNIGIVQVNGNMQVNGVSSLTYVTGTVVVDGNYIAGSVINLGDANSDTIAFTADENSDLIPKITNTYSLGSATKQWNNVYAQQLVGTGVTTTSATAGGITLSGNSIYSTNIASDITISPLGTGNVTFNGLTAFTQNNINNNTVRVYNAPYYLLSTGDGYVNFAGTNGVVFPVGTTAQRNTIVTGTTRYNTDLGFLEIYNGTTWQNSNGNIPLATASDINDSSVIYDLILG